MKKFIAALIFMTAVFGISAAADNPDIYIDGELLETEVSPVNIEGRVLVPMRAIFEALGAEVSWDGGAETVWATRDGAFMSIGIGSNTIDSGVFNTEDDPVWVDHIELDVPAQQVTEGYTYVPVRAVSEVLGAYVRWDGEKGRVIIDSRKDDEGVVYYASDSDYQKLYCADFSGADRRKLSERRVRELEMHDGYVYYLENGTNYLYRASKETGEELLIPNAVNKIAVSGGYIYYQELDDLRIKSGALYRMKLETGDKERITDNSVLYPEKHGDLLYFNLHTDNFMYAKTLDGSEVYTIDVGDCAYAKLYPFNCFFYGDYILVEDGVWFGELMRCDRDGGNVIKLLRKNAILAKNQQYDGNIIYMQPDNGQDIYCIGIDGSDNHLVHKGDPLWLDVDILEQWGDTVYYKHPMRQEVYRVNLDGSDDRYVCYADSVQVKDGRLFTSFLGLYVGNTDGTDLECLYDRSIKGFALLGDKVYFKDKQSTRLYMCDYNGRGGSVTADSVGEWVTDAANETELK